MQRDWKQVKVDPWIGNDYEHPRLFPRRALVLGESNYTSPANFTSKLVFDCVNEHVTNNPDEVFSRFATKIRRVVLGPDRDCAASEFWKDVAFYNFIQFHVGESSRRRPSLTQWEESVPAFREVVQELRPGSVLVLGLANWNNLLAHVDHATVDEHRADLSVDGQRVVAGYVNHPSSGGHFTYKVWHPVADLVLGTRSAPDHQA